jgi:hypothetical protein
MQFTLKKTKKTQEIFSRTIAQKQLRETEKKESGQFAFVEQSLQMQVHFTALRILHSNRSV